MKKTTKKKCTKCYGYGFWPIGSKTPIGPIDAGEWGELTLKCPECGAGGKK
jgi:hypothetical protein